MPKTPAGHISRDLFALFNSGTIVGLSDEDLLHRYLASRDNASEAAFAALIRRHGPMVFRICCLILRDRHEAEDAYQATFLVLARNAASIRRRDSLGPYLHGVALRVARSARSESERRQRHLRIYADQARDFVSAPAMEDLGRELHEEIGRLPRKYREVAVLCLVEGRTYSEAAILVDCPQGTIMSRLSEARRRLRGRLARQGQQFGIGDIGIFLSGGLPAMGAWRSSALTDVTIEAAMHFAAGNGKSTGIVSATVLILAEEELKGMFLTKLVSIGAAACVMAVACVSAEQEPVPRGSADRVHPVQAGRGRSDGVARSPREDHGMMPVANGPGARKQKARQLLRDARRAIAKADLEGAAAKVAEARSLDVGWGLYDDTPDKVATLLRQQRSQGRG